MCEPQVAYPCKAKFQGNEAEQQKKSKKGKGSKSEGGKKSSGILTPFEPLEMNRLT